MQGIVGLSDLLTAMGFQTDADGNHTLENQRKVTAKLSSLDVPYLGIGKNIRGHRRGVLVDSDALQATMAEVAATRARKRQAKAMSKAAEKAKAEGKRAEGAVSKAAKALVRDKPRTGKGAKADK